MKALINLAAAVVLVFCLQSQSFASNQGLNGLIIGGGTGAILGQAVGKNVESTIIGATVGGILGAAIGAESSYRHHDRVIVHERLRRPQGPHGRYFNYAPRHNRPDIGHNRPYYRDHNSARDTVIIIKKNGRKHLQQKNYRTKNKGHQNPRHGGDRPRFNQNNRW